MTVQEAIDRFNIDVTLWTTDAPIVYRDYIDEEYNGSVPEYDGRELWYNDEDGMIHYLEFIKGRGSKETGCEVVFESAGEFYFYTWTQSSNGVGKWEITTSEPDEESALGEFLCL